MVYLYMYICIFEYGYIIIYSGVQYTCALSTFSTALSDLVNPRCSTIWKKINFVLFRNHYKNGRSLKLFIRILNGGLFNFKNKWLNLGDNCIKKSVARTEKLSLKEGLLVLFVSFKIIRSLINNKKHNYFHYAKPLKTAIRCENFGKIVK
jgi:hypothetical protein